MGKHSPFCSTVGRDPCPCYDWPDCAAEMFPNLVDACPSLCPVHGPAQPGEIDPLLSSTDTQGNPPPGWEENNAKPHPPKARFSVKLRIAKVLKGKLSHDQ